MTRVESVLVRARTFTDLVAAGMAVIAGVLMVLLMLGTVADVARRQIQNTGIPGVVEGSEVVLVMLVFLSVGYAQRMSAHVTMDMVSTRMPDRASRILEAAGLLLVVILLTWASYHALRRGLDSLASGETRFGLIPIPLWPGRMLVPLGATVLALELSFTALERLHAIPLRQESAGDQSADMI